jgi:hypothetical protein
MERCVESQVPKCQGPGAPDEVGKSAAKNNHESSLHGTSFEPVLPKTGILPRSDGEPCCQRPISGIGIVVR